MDRREFMKTILCICMVVVLALSACTSQDSALQVPTAAALPSLTITNTVTATNTPRAVVAMQPQRMTVRSMANLRSCARTDCARAAQVQARDIVTVTGTTQGEAVNGGSTLWYRVDYNGQALYIYSSLVAEALPTRISPTRTALPTRVFAPSPVPQQAAPSDPLRGATAVCRDGWISYSAHRRGTCSHHGGVARWINDPPS